MAAAESEQSRPGAHLLPAGNQGQAGPSGPCFHWNSPRQSGAPGTAAAWLGAALSTGEPWHPARLPAPSPGQHQPLLQLAPTVPAISGPAGVGVKGSPGTGQRGGRLPCRVSQSSPGALHLQRPAREPTVPCPAGPGAAQSPDPARGGGLLPRGTAGAQVGTKPKPPRKASRWRLYCSLETPVSVGKSRVPSWAGGQRREGPEKHLRWWWSRRAEGPATSRFHPPASVPGGGSESPGRAPAPAHRSLGAGIFGRRRLRDAAEALEERQQ